MTIEKIGEMLAIVRLEVDPTQMQPLLQKHAERFPGTTKCEAAGRALIHDAFEPQKAKEFVKRVCEWGRGHRLVGRVCDANSSDAIAVALRESVSLANSGKISLGVERIRKLQYLGQSFASKQLRFMMPAKAVIFDRVIRTRLGYPETGEGYTEFLNDCQRILSHVRKSEQIKDTFKKQLRVCDIEAALYSQLQGY